MKWHEWYTSFATKHKRLDTVPREMDPSFDWATAIEKHMSPSLKLFMDNHPEVFIPLQRGFQQLASMADRPSAKFELMDELKQHLNHLSREVESDPHLLLRRRVHDSGKHVIGAPQLRHGSAQDVKVGAVGLAELGVVVSTTGLLRPDTNDAYMKLRSCSFRRFL